MSEITVLLSCQLVIRPAKGGQPCHDCGELTPPEARGAFMIVNGELIEDPLFSLCEPCAESAQETPAFADPNTDDEDPA